MKLRFRRLAALAAGAGLVVGGMLLTGPVSPASADPVSAPLCQNEASGHALHGTYNNLTVRGVAYVADGATLTVRHNLVLTPTSCLDAFSMGTVHVGGNVLVRRGATLALGCMPFANGSLVPCDGVPNDTVGGNLVATQPRTMYLTAVHVGGNVASYGGGQVGASFPIKGMTIGGNLVVEGWAGGAGGWFGMIGNHIGANAVLIGNSGERPNANGGPDSNEVDGNWIGANLVCYGNNPAAQFGDAPAPNMNTVMGAAVGQCAALATR